MLGRKLEVTIKPKITTVPYSIVEKRETPQDGKIAFGKVSLAYKGGGEWVVVCIDTKDNNSSTVHFRVQKTGEITKVDSRTSQESAYGKIELGGPGQAKHYAEFDIARDYAALVRLLTEGISEHHTRTFEAHPEASVYLHSDLGKLAN